MAAAVVEVLHLAGMWPPQQLLQRQQQQRCQWT
jgi:hypothetical protein